jgi:DNA-binding winged helix-turn-helix (wHTH) protein
VDNHISSLRAKLETDSEAPRWILTVHGVGYRLQVQGAILHNRDSAGAFHRHTPIQEDEA